MSSTERLVGDLLKQVRIACAVMCSRSGLCEDEDEILVRICGKDGLCQAGTE